ncbi:MAG: hypothetical protein WA783_22770 [Phormidesmis sp.]
MAFQTDADLKAAYAERLRKEGQGVSVDVSVGKHGGTIDILTDRAIIFCTLELNQTNAIVIRSQLGFYGRLSPNWQKVIVVQKVVEPTAVSLLTTAGIKLVDLSAELSANTTKFTSNTTEPTPPSLVDKRQTPRNRENVYFYPALDSVEGGEGLRVAILAIAVVLFVGICGLVISSVL